MSLKQMFRITVFWSLLFKLRFSECIITLTLLEVSLKLIAVNKAVSIVVRRKNDSDGLIT